MQGIKRFSELIFVAVQSKARAGWSCQAGSAIKKGTEVSRWAFVGLQRFDSDHLPFMAAGAFAGSSAKQPLLGESPALSP